MCLKVILVLFSACSVYGLLGVDMRCRNSSDITFSIQPLNTTTSKGTQLAGEETGRYVMTWCTTHLNKSTVTTWDLYVNLFNNTTNAKDCTEVALTLVRPTTHSHDGYYAELSSQCSDVCFSRNLSNMFTACYQFRNKVTYHIENSTKEQTATPVTNMVYLTSHFSRQKFVDAKPSANCVDYSPNLSITWFSNVIPIEEYSIIIYENAKRDRRMIDISDNCTVLDADRQLQCDVDMESRGLRPGSYVVQYSYEAPWVNSELKTNHTFRMKCDYTGPGKEAGVPVPQEDAGMPWWGVALMGACGVLLVAAAAALVWTRRVWSDKVHRMWTTAVQGEHSLTSAGVTYRSVLLVYARDHRSFNDAMERLAKLLWAATGLEVIDLHRAETCARMAAAPTQFIQECFLHSYVVVVAGPALHRVNQEGEVLYLPPKSSDSHLRLLLTLLRQRAHSAHASPYKQLFMCYMSESPTAEEEANILSDVVPFTRFALPGSVGALLQHLQPAALRRESESETALVGTEPRGRAELFHYFSTALHQFTEYARCNPDYLDDLLITIA